MVCSFEQITFGGIVGEGEGGGGGPYYIGDANHDGCSSRKNAIFIVLGNKSRKKKNILVMFLEHLKCNCKLLSFRVRIPNCFPRSPSSVGCPDKRKIMYKTVKFSIL